VIAPDGNSNNKIYHFYRKNKLYVGDFAEVDKWERAPIKVHYVSTNEGEISGKVVSDVYINTVSENMKMFTKREVQDALKALKLKQDMGYPSSRELIKMISSGGIINCPVTIEDIHRADFI